MLLLNLVELLKNNGYHTDVLMREGYGDLIKEFSSLGSTRSFFDPVTSLPHRAYNKGKRVAGLHPFKKNNYDLVINNTITNGAIIHHYSQRPLVTYVHEMETAIKHHAGPELLKKNTDHSRLFLYPSEAVKQVLKNLLHLPDERLMYLPYYIKDHFSVKEKSRPATRQQLHLKEEQVLVGGMAVPGWRKGSDYFIFLANEFKEDDRFKFLWLGSDDENNGGQGFNQLLVDKKMFGLDNLEVLPSVANPWSYMAAMDVFFLPSREDPYPLVVPEAAMMELPIICFENTGGANEFVGSDCGYRLPYLSLEAARDLLLNIVGNREPSLQAGKAARKKYLGLHTGEIVLKYFKEIEARINEIKNRS